MTPERSPGESSSKRNIVFIADGWSRDLFLEMLSAGDLESISEYLVERGGLLPDVVSNLPSVSLSSHTSILTSSFQDEHAIAGHRWRNGVSGTVTDYLRTSGHRNVNADISPTVSTIFETSQGPGVSVQGVIERGAEVRFHLPTMRPGPILRTATKAIIHHPTSNAVIWLPRVDALSHIHGPGKLEIRDEMARTSTHMGSFFVDLARQGLLDQARIALISDHGHERVVRSIPLERPFARAGVDLSVNRRRNVGARALALTSGDRSAHVYLQEEDRRRRSEIARIVSSDPGVELGVWQEGDGTWHFANDEGESVAIWVDEHTVSYETVFGRDPLDLTVLGNEIDVSSPILGAGKYPDFLHQVMRSRVPGRSGDLLLFAAKLAHFGRGPRIGYRLGFHRGSHGGPFYDEVVVAAAYRSDEPIEPAATRSADLLRRLGMIPTKRREESHHPDAHSI